MWRNETAISTPAAKGMKKPECSRPHRSYLLMMYIPTVVTTHASKPVSVTAPNVLMNIDPTRDRTRIDYMSNRQRVAPIFTPVIEKRRDILRGNVPLQMVRRGEYVTPAWGEHPNVAFHLLLDFRCGASHRSFDVYP
jgi:hypothetical protein